MTARKALAYSFLDRYASLLLAVGASMVIARLLSPSEMGIFSVTMVLVNVASAMRDMGAGQYLIQERDLTVDRQRSAWGILLVMGLFLGTAVALAAEPLAGFYGEPSMIGIMWVIACNFFLTPFGSLTYAWLTREMRFGNVAVMRFSGSFLGAVVSVLLAWRGFGPISLAYGNLASTLGTAMTGVMFRPNHFDWRPGFSDVRRVIGFGSKISATAIVANLTSGFPELSLGKLQTLTAAGLFSRGNGLATMFHRLVMDATNTVALPVFAKSQRETGSSLRPWLHATSLVTALGWPFLGGLALLAHPVTRILYGNQWDDSVVVAQWVSVGMMLGLPVSLCPQLLIGTGNATGMLKAMTMSTAIQVVGISVGAYFGLSEAAFAFAICQGFGALVWIREVRRIMPFDWRDLSSLLFRSLKVALPTLFVPLACVALLGSRPNSSVLPIATSLVLGLPLFYFASKFFAHPIYDEASRLIKKVANLFGHSN